MQRYLLPLSVFDLCGLGPLGLSVSVGVCSWVQIAFRVSCKHRQARQTDCSIPLIIRVESSNQSAWLACVYTIR